MPRPQCPLKQKAGRMPTGFLSCRGRHGSSEARVPARLSHALLGGCEGLRRQSRTNSQLGSNGGTDALRRDDSGTGTRGGRRRISMGHSIFVSLPRLQPERRPAIRLDTARPPMAPRWTASGVRGELRVLEIRGGPGRDRETVGVDALETFPRADPSTSATRLTGIACQPRSYLARALQGYRNPLQVTRTRPRRSPSRKAQCGPGPGECSSRIES